VSAMEPREFRRHPFILIIELVTALFAISAALWSLSQGRTSSGVLMTVVFIIALGNFLWGLLTPAVRVTDRELICYPGFLGRPTSFDLSEIRSVARASLGDVVLVLADDRKVKVPGASFLSDWSRAALMGLLKRAIAENEARRSERSI